ncbi:thioredoxin domain-containing protein [Halomicronema hongdechloris C2206]|uniref:Thioredoxin domain-containing protein n=1 Tax=Halomicronema hongdechloris C2206 TaxID=1641165 RepID=A0A1Z3HMG5_9CYAN|nr:thioredoxin domain-containing protein [Halomicronema hongdechloris]ASC71499.1 thioredoxin domain-containing protein [Halomicronema hongdechloris C2206]
MTVNPLLDALKRRFSPLIPLVIIGVFAIATLWLTRPAGSAPGPSLVSGLMTLKATAQAATPYDAAMANGKPTLLEFYADWCTTCQAMAPTLQALHHQFGHQVNLVMLNIDDPQWQQPLERFQVKGVPHLVLLQADGTVADSVTGKVPRSILSHRLGDLL